MWFSKHFYASHISQDANDHNERITVLVITSYMDSCCPIRLSLHRLLNEVSSDYWRTFTYYSLFFDVYFIHFSSYIYRLLSTNNSCDRRWLIFLYAELLERYKEEFSKRGMANGYAVTNQTKVVNVNNRSARIRSSCIGVTTFFVR